MAYIRRGFGDYEGAANAPTWPYSANRPSSGDGCGCGGTCAGCGGHGMGLFDSMDPTTWGAGEYAVALGIGYVAVKLVGDAGKAGKAVKRRARKSPKSTAGGLGFVGIIALAGGAYYLYTKSQSTGVSGFGDYQAQGYTGPQLLTSPTRSADIMIPAGW